MREKKEETVDAPTCISEITIEQNIIESGVEKLHFIRHKMSFLDLTVRQERKRKISELTHSYVCNNHFQTANTRKLAEKR